MSGDKGTNGDVTVTRSASVLPTDEGGSTANTLEMVECNDCTLARLIQCLEKEGTVPKGYTLPGAPFTGSPLTLNMVGLRIKGTISNKFDDRLIVFYRPVDLNGSNKVEDAATIEKTYGLNVAAIDAFLGQSNVRSELKVASGEPELPGQDSLSKDKKPCKVHAGWKLLRFVITTDPGYEKDAKAMGVKVSDAEPNVLGQGRAVLEPGILSDSHRVGIHHYNDLKGYVALTQRASFSVRRAFTAAHIKAEMKAIVSTWEKEWKAYKKAADAKYTKEEAAYEKKEAAYQKELEAYNNAVAAGKKAKQPTPPTAPTAPTEMEPWVKEHVAKQLNALLFGDAYADYNTKSKTHRSFVREIREKTLAGTKHEASGVSVDYTLTQKQKDPKKPDLSWVLEVTSISAALKPSGARTLSDDDIVVVSDYGWPGINIHRSNKAELQDPNVYDWSKGCQVFKGFNDYKQFRRLFELSKIARCSRRGAKGDCPALSHPEIMVDDLIWHYYATAQEKAEYEKGGKTADDLLRAKLTGDELDKQFTSRIKERVKAIAFDDSPGAAPAKKPRFKIAKDATARTTAIKDAISEKLLPGADDDAIRGKVRDDKAVLAALQQKLEAYVQSDLDESATLKAKYDEKVAEYKAKAIAAKKKEAAAQKEAETKAASDADVLAVKKSEEDASVKKKAGKLKTELTSLSNEVKDKVDWTIKDIRKQLDAKRGEFNDEGLEYCDLLGQCPTTFDYVLVEAEKPDVKEIDDRFA